jgi:ketosteroid isomerase-like protein
MSQENVEVVRRVFDSVNRGEWDTVLAAYSQDTEWDDRDLRPEGAVYRGIDAMVREMRAWIGTWANYWQEIEQIATDGDQVAVVIHESGEGKGSGAVMDQRIGALITVQDGLVVRTRLFRDPTEALKAVGLSEQDARGGKSS